jgi:hypothetical protein
MLAEIIERAARLKTQRPAAADRRPRAAVKKNVARKPAAKSPGKKSSR